MARRWAKVEAPEGRATRALRRVTIAVAARAAQGATAEVQECGHRLGTVAAKALGVRLRKVPLLVGSLLIEPRQSRRQS